MKKCYWLMKKMEEEWFWFIQEANFHIIHRQLLITRMRSNPHYKLGRISFFFFSVKVVANCNACCDWLHIHCSHGSSCCFFIRIQRGICRIWKVSCGELRDCFTRCTSPRLVAKREQIVCMTSCEFNELAAKPKFVAQSRPALYSYSQRVDRASWRTRNIS